MNKTERVVHLGQALEYMRQYGDQNLDGQYAIYLRCEALGNAGKAFSMMVEYHDPNAGELKAVVT